MSEKETQTPNSPEVNENESILDFDEAKDMTIGQAMRRSAEIEAGVTDEDSVLDKYIKQHKEEILAGKFDTIHGEASEFSRSSVNEAGEEKDLTDLDSFIQEIRSGESREHANKDESETLSLATEDDLEYPSGEEVLASHQNETKLSQPTLTHGGYDDVPVAEALVTESMEENESELEPIIESAVAKEATQPVFTSDVEYQWDNEVPLYKRKSVIYTSLALLAVLIGGSALYWGLTRNGGNTAASTSQTSSQSKSNSTSSSSSENSAQKAFDDLYASFFTDDKQTTLKNGSFGNLDSLKTALDKLEKTNGYEAAKKKYDDLVKQISAIQTVNGQFKTAVITDGVVDTNAQVKSDAVFNDVTTGNTNLDKILTQAIEQGRAQAVPAPGPVQTAPTTTTPASPSVASTATQESSGDIKNAGVPGFGLSSVGVNLQRNLSRVPYNQDAINDVNNPAWTFNPGILEKILQTARDRGHITGDQYILEKVNIIKGNGYYNLFKPDGTYLFSINAKTGYFVGNGKGHADALDY